MVRKKQLQPGCNIQLLCLAKEKGLHIANQVFDNDEMNHIMKQFPVPRVCKLFEESGIADRPAKGV